MGDDVVRMMADLGLARRDIVSAPAADAKGRMIREDPRESRIVIEDFEGHREQARAKAPELQAWNSQRNVSDNVCNETDLYTDDANFESDEVTARLENRFSGQGHRAGLQATIAQKYGHDHSCEANESRLGEERRLYLQERNLNGNSSYVATAQPTYGREFRDNSFGTNTPRSFSDGNATGHHMARGRVTSSGAPNPNRAPSPRAAGSVRILSGGRRIENPPPASRSRAAPLTAAGSRITPNSAPLIRNPPTGPLVSSLPNGTVFPWPAFATVKPSPTTGACDHDYVAEKEYRMRACYWAANPSPECDTYYQKHPDQQIYIHTAVREFIKDAFRLAKDPHGRETADYLATHKDRKWMFQEASKAKAMVENGQVAANDRHYEACPARAVFGQAAKFYFKPTPQAAVVAAAPASPAVARHSIPSKAPATTALAPLSPTAATKTQLNGPTKLPGTFPQDENQPKAGKPSPSVKGTLSAEFHDLAGTFLTKQIWPLNAPGNLELNLKCAQGAFNVRELTAAVESIATTLGSIRQGSVGRSATTGEEQGVAADGVQTRRQTGDGTRRLGDSTLADDGLWVED